MCTRLTPPWCHVKRQWCHCGVDEVGRVSGAVIPDHPNAVMRGQCGRASMRNRNRRTAMAEPAAIARIVRRPIRNAESRESTALLLGSAAFVLGTAVALIVFWGRDVPISGRGSLGGFVAVAGAVTAIVAFVVGSLLRRAEDASGPAGAARRPALRWF